MPAPAGLARVAGELDAAVGPEQGRPRVAADRRPREQPLHGRPGQRGRWDEGDAEAAGGVVGVDQQLVAGHGREPGGVGQPVRVPAPRSWWGGVDHPGQHGGEGADHPDQLGVGRLGWDPQLHRVLPLLAGRQVGGVPESALGDVDDGLGDRPVHLRDRLGPVPVDGRAQQRPALAGGLEHVPAIHGSISPTPPTAAGPTETGRRIVGSCPPQEEVVVVTTRRGVDANRWELAHLFGFLLAPGRPVTDGGRP